MAGGPSCSSSSAASSGSCVEGGGPVSVMSAYVRSLQPTVCLSVRLKALHDMSKFLSTVEGDEGGEAHKLCRDEHAVPMMMSLLKECGLQDSVLLQCVLSCFVNLTYIGGPELIKDDVEAFELLLKMLLSSDVSTQFYAVAGVFNMSKDEDCVERIRTPETDAALKGMLKSDNKSIARYASKTLSSVASYPMNCGKGVGGKGMEYTALQAARRRSVLTAILIIGFLANYAISGTTFVEVELEAVETDPPVHAGSADWESPSVLQLLPLLLMWGSWLACVFALGLKDTKLPRSLSRTVGAVSVVGDAAAVAGNGLISFWQMISNRLLPSKLGGGQSHDSSYGSTGWMPRWLARKVFGRERSSGGGGLPLAMSMNDLQASYPHPPPCRKSASEPHLPPPLDLELHGIGHLNSNHLGIATPISNRGSSTTSSSHSHSSNHSNHSNHSFGSVTRSVGSGNEYDIGGSCRWTTHNAMSNGGPGSPEVQMEGVIPYELRAVEVC